MLCVTRAADTNIRLNCNHYDTVTAGLLVTDGLYYRTVTVTQQGAGARWFKLPVLFRSPCSSDRP